MVTRGSVDAILGAAMAVLLTIALDASAQQAVIVVRHAEKADQTPDTALSAQGKARAKSLADLLRGAGVTHIITSEYLRTRDTAAPLAAALGLTIEQVPARDLAGARRPGSRRSIRPPSSSWSGTRTRSRRC